jgi:hypothetical protein
MPFKPAPDWVEAFPEEPEAPSPSLPPARQRTRTTPVQPGPHEASHGDASLTASIPAALEETDAPTAEIPVEEETAGSDLAYAVGYKKPPLQTRFKPGHSGNPKGRPKKAKSLNTIVRETLGGKVAVRTAAGTKKISRIEAVLQKTLEQAMKGNPRAQMELIKLWRGAVPDEVVENTATCDEDLTAADFAMLEAYRAQLFRHEGTRP